MYLSEIINIIEKYDMKEKRINKIKTDSRLLEPDDVFICINSGYKYIEDAIKKEVSLIITEKDIKYDTDIPIIKVDSTIRVLGDIAKYIRNKYKGTVIAITGSNGKTTTKELLSYILSSKYKVLKTNGSKNNNIGVPNTILELDDSYDYLVLELGTNHPGEIKYLTDIVKPDIAIITNIGSSHIGNFGSIDNIYIEKISIKVDNTVLFVNGEDNYLKNTNGVKVYNDEYNYVCSNPHLNIDYYLVFKVCEYLGMNITEIINRANSFEMAESRMNFMNINGITLIDDSYNASYESVVAGINSLDKERRKVIILGDMLELGKFSSKLHMSLNEEIKKLNNYYLITIGDATKVMESNKHFNYISELNNYIKLFKFNSNDVIYVKGAHGMKLCKVVNILKNVLQNI